ncbi:MAG: DMT family transporter [bacterium]|nr:DMT family transporter [bacterium]MCP5070128.1 DMT family transporter [bacterium]
MPHEQRRGLAWALGAALGIAGFAVPWKLANTLGDASVNTLVLLASAALFSSALATTQQRGLPRFLRFDLVFAAGLASLTLAGNLASAQAISLISPALLTVVQRAEIIVVALMAWLFIGEHVDRRFWLGAGVAAVGLWVLRGPAGAEDAQAVGIAWAGVSVICFSGMAVLTRKYVSRIDTVVVNGLRLWIAVIFWFAVNGLPPALNELSPAQAGYAALAAFCGPFAGRLCLMNAAKYLEARISTMATLAAPPLTLVLGFLVLSDLPSSRELIGSAIMLAGVAIPISRWARTRTR